MLASKALKAGALPTVMCYISEGIVVLILIAQKLWQKGRVDNA